MEAASELAKSGLRFVILPSPDGKIDPLVEVAAGRAQFGVVGADRLLEANAAGGRFVAVGVVNHVSPTVFLTRDSSRIQGPRDFVGRRVGILVGTTTVSIFELMLRRQKVDPSSVRAVEVPFDLALFLQGGYDVRPAFAYDEPVALDLAGVRYSTIRPEQFGVNFLGTVYFTTDSLIKARPDLVKQVVWALATGWERAIANPEEAIRALKQQFPEVDDQRELAGLRKGVDYFHGDSARVLSARGSTWRGTYDGLLELGKIKPTDDVLARSVDSSFVASFHRSRSASLKQ